MADRIEIAVVAIDQASGVISSMTSKIKSSIASVMAVTAGLGAALSAGFLVLGREALDATAEYERMTLTIESLTARELRAADATLSMADALRLAGPAAQETLQWIQKLAIASPFDMASVQIAYRQALTFGFASDQARVLTQNMVDFAAANGLTAEAMNTVSYALGQINNNDKVLMLDLRQLMQVGVPVLDILNEMGMSFEDVSDGAVKSAEFITKFNEVMERDFGGAAARQLSTWTGLINTFGDLRKMALRELFAGIFDELKPLVTMFSEWLQGPGLVKLHEWGDALGEITLALLSLPADLRGKTFEDLANMAGDFWVNFTANLLHQARSVDWSGLSQAIADKVGDIDWNLLGQKLGAGLRNAFNVIFEIATEVDWGALFSASLSAAAEFFIGTFGVTMDQAKRIVNDTMDGIKTSFVTTFSQIAASIPSFLASLIPMLGQIGAVAGQTLMTNLGNAIKAGLNAIIAIIKQVAAAIGAALSKINLPFAGGGGTTTTTRPPSSGSTSGGGRPNTNRAAGGSFTVPAGYPNDSYTMGLTSGERVNVNPAGGNGGGMTVNLTYAPAFSTADRGELLANIVPILDEWYRRRLTA